MSAHVDPSALVHMSSLQHLLLQECWLLPSSEASAAAFLAAIGGMQKLVSLSLYWCNFFLTDAQAEACAALTAAAHLTSLTIAVEDTEALPRGAVQHMFAGGKQLRSLVFRTSSSYEFEASCMSAGDLQLLFRSCRRLKELTMDRVVEPGDVASVLLQLPPSCTHLAVGGHAFGDAAAAAIKQLLQLKCLTWRCSETLTDLGVEQLTALTLGEFHLERSECCFRACSTNRRH